MWQNQYPKTIQMRKSLGVALGVGFALIVLLVLYNMGKSQQQDDTTQNQANTLLPTEHDVAWVERAANAAQQEKQNLTVAAILPPNAALPLQPGIAQLSMQSTPRMNHAQRREQHAMSAAINSNMLVPSTQSSTSSGVAPTGNSGVGNNATSPNQAFLHSHQTSGPDYLSSRLQNPVSPFEVQAGTIIPGILLSGINSNLPGQIIGQVRENVYDSISGRSILIPQGAKLIGVYDANVAYGQSRVLVAWKRIIFPNGQSIDLQGMPGADLSGYAGFHDLVNNHYLKIFGSVILMSVLSAGAQLSQPQQSQSPFAAPTVSQTIAQSLGQNISNAGTMLLQKDLNIAPTIEIRPGYEFNIMVTKDMVFPGPYQG